MSRPTKLKRGLNKPKANLTWYILWILSVANYKFVTSVLSEYNLWIPTYNKLIRYGYDCAYVRQPIYPEYVFVGVKDVSEIATVTNLLKNNGCDYKFLTKNNIPVAYSPEDFSDSLPGVVPAKPIFLVGDAVVVLTGPLINSYGKIKKIHNNIIYVDVFNYDIHIELEILEKFSDVYLRHSIKRNEYKDDNEFISEIICDF